MKIKNRWIKSKLGEFIEIEMGQSPKSEFYNNQGLGMPFLQGNRTFGDRYPYFDTYCIENKKIALEKDVIMSVRAPVGDLNIATEDISIGRGVCALRAKNNQNQFLYYLLKYNVKNLINKESGTVFGSVNKNDILGLEIEYPEDIKTQEKIASILSALDDKIEINNEMNKTLEEMAQTLFKRWFIDFDFPNENGEPYRSSGGKMVDSELGEIPEGWEVKTLKSCTKKITDGTHGTVKDNLYGQYLLLSCKNIKNGTIVLGDKERKIDIETFLKLRKRTELQFNDILLTTVGTIGETAIIRDETINYEFQRSVAILRIDDQILSPELFYIYTKSHTFLSQVFGRVKGSVQKCLFLGEISEIKIIVPAKKDCKYIQNTYEIILKKIKKNQQEIQSLTEIRDTLLPKLMSGEIEV